ELQGLPFTVKAELRDSYPFGMLAVPLEETVRIHASSGTRGKPTVVAYTPRDIESFAEVNARAIACAGGTPDDVLHVAYGYGLFTVVGPGVAMECREGKGALHVFDDHFLPEVVDAGTGEPVGGGELGELVLTTLTKEALPVIRYRTGDMTTWVDEGCPCGRTF